MTELTIKRGPQKGETFPIDTFPCTLGRNPSNAIVLQDDEVSNFHLRIKKRGKLFVIEDLDSRNGCFLNGERIVNSILQSGDRILVGKTELEFVAPMDEIDIAAKVLNLNLVIDEKLGIQGPIAIQEGKQSSIFEPIPVLSGTGDIKKIYELQGNIIVNETIEDASQALLKGIAKLAPTLSRCAMFIWSPIQRQLIPFAMKHLPSDERPFHINQQVLTAALSTKQGFVIPPRAPDQGGTDRHRVVLPMVQNKEVICLLHLEFDQTKKAAPFQDLASIISLIERCAATFESFMLRKEIDALMLGMVETIVATIEAKDTYTVGHSERVSRFSMAIADEIKLNRETKKMLMISSLCHDIGKIGIPDAILKKAALLSREEYEEMKLHPTIGANIIANIPNAQRFISGVKYHHEKWDGTGYPEGLVGENIPFFGRIVAIADVFDAMISGRSYSGFIDESDAIDKIQQESDLFDPDLLKALVRAWDKGTVTQRTSTVNSKKGKG